MILIAILVYRTLGRFRVVSALEWYLQLTTQRPCARHSEGVPKIGYSSLRANSVSCPRSYHVHSDVWLLSGRVERSEQCVYLLQGRAERLASR